nr:hypothetical protein [Mycolicibacterium sphagni]
MIDCVGRDGVTAETGAAEVATRDTCVSHFRSGRFGGYGPCELVDTAEDVERPPDTGSGGIGGFSKRSQFDAGAPQAPD